MFSLLMLECAILLLPVSCLWSFHYYYTALQLWHSVYFDHLLHSDLRMSTMLKTDSSERYKGRSNGSVSCSNADSSIPDTFEPIAALPRSHLPMDDLISVVRLNMYEQRNKMIHSTDMYDSSQLIVRRGQEFVLGIIFNRPFQPQRDVVNIEFRIGKNPNSTQGTLITVSLGNKNYVSSKWKCRVLETTSTETKVGVTSASDCIVGLFSTYVTVLTNQGTKRTERDHRTDIYILFNAWNPSDVAFLPSENEREEYVLNSVGIMYNGVVDKIENRPWNYGQFQNGVLDACLFILDFGEMPLEYRGDVIKMTRQASDMMNSQDDDGVVEGNWGDDFSFGTAPTAWTGSPEILLSYASKGGVPVKYGQCWVFAGVFNTFLRCLGLASRVITNYCSAHDNMGDLTTDIVLDEDGQIDPTYTRDSIWNFHCWNEVFMKRSDLPQAYSGWQVVDSTPQETSEGYYRCGPTSVRAVKEGQLGYAFDAPFVFAEVNSDVVFYKRDKYGNKRVVHVNTDYVGQLIVTKMIGSNDPEDVTHTYKYPEGSAEDKRTMQQAHNHGMNTDHRDRSSLPAANIQLHLQAKQVNKAGDISLTIIVSNLGNQMQSINIKLTGKVDYYTGATSHQFKLTTQEMTLEAWETKQHVVTVSASEYKKFLTGKPFLFFIAYGLVSETDLSLISMAVVRLGSPPLLIEVSGTSKVGEDMYVTVKFTNTLSRSLNNVTLRMEGTDLMPLKIKQYSNIPHGSTVKWTESFTPKKSGSKVLMACLDCAALKEVCGQVEVFIDSKDS